MDFSMRICLISDTATFFSYYCSVYRPASFKCSVLCVSCSVTSLRINSTVALWSAELLVGGWEETSSSALPYL